MLFGFERIDGRWVERVPTLFQSFSPKEQREFFINQYNCCVGKDERVAFRKGFGSLTLFEIFKSKILSRLKVKNRLRKNELKTFDPYSAVLIALFIKGDYEELKRVIEANAFLPKISQAMLIFRIFSSANCGIVFDAKTLFSEFVLEKITRKNPDKEVYFKDGLIAVEKDGECLLNIMLCFKKFDKDKIYLVKDEIDEAWRKVAKGNIRSLYIVFPKNSAFKRHIEVKNPCFTNSLVKLVPYTI
ncbi:MAG: hypothetical protein LBQ18_05155 [Campylobacteraceae bacterium]|jgi:hypothetical protein|nr:hypothetical protein [Campylobacteraceae bacterium]